MRRIVIATNVLAILAGSSRGQDTTPLLGSPDPLDRLALEPAFPHLRFKVPVQVTHSPDDTNRLFVATVRGRILGFSNRTGAKQTTVFLDIRDRVRFGGDSGFMDFTFDPDFARTGRVYVYYCARGKREKIDAILSRFVVSKESRDHLDPDSEQILLRIPQPRMDHKAGCIKFGPDGKLWFASGDGGLGRDGLPTRHGQDTLSLLGTLVRLDVSGASVRIPRDNPFVGDPKVRDEIWAYGLRAPWRFCFAPDGSVWLGDNGQWQFEELNIIVKGGNYGWPDREGFLPFDPSSSGKRRRGPPRGTELRLRGVAKGDSRFVDPILEYPHPPRGGGRSVVGGFFYRGNRLPALRGAYVYGDYETGEVFALEYRDRKVVKHKRIARARRKILSFGEDAKGELLLTAVDGRVHRLRRVEPDTAHLVFPRRLSSTGLFADTAKLRPNPGLIPYDVNVPLWSDGADKRRWFVLPSGGRVTIAEDGGLAFPVGTVFIKTFLLPKTARRLETRLLVHAPAGFVGYTYVWNDAQTDAELIDGAVRRRIKDGERVQDWYFPSRGDCMACHTAKAGFVLGGNLRQLHRGDQLQRWKKRGIFAGELPKQIESYPRWGDRTAPSSRLARAYLAVNCANCHAPPHWTTLDLRFDTARKDLGAIGIDPLHGRLGARESKLVMPGKPGESELILRMTERGELRMPPMGSKVPDARALDVLRRWIRELR